MFTKHFDAIKLHKVHHFADLMNKPAITACYLTPCNKHSVNIQSISRKESSIKKQHKRKE